MNRLKIVVIGLLSGASITTAAALLTLAGRKALLEYVLNQAVTGEAAAALFAVSIPVGAVSGAVAACVIQGFTPGESRLLALLASMAIGSVGIMLGGFGGGSRLPLVIYGIAVINGLLTIPVCRRLNRRLSLPHIGEAVG